MYVRPFLNWYPQDIPLFSVSTVWVSRRGPFQTRLTLNSTSTGSADDSRYGEVPLNVMDVTLPANTASARSRASAGEPEGPHVQAWADSTPASSASKAAANPATSASRLAEISAKPLWLLS